MRRYGKGNTRRTELEQRALAVRILDERHLDDVYERAVQELGRRATRLGPLDMSRNALSMGVERVNAAYLTPPLADDLSDELAAYIGDASARVTVARYREAGGRPLPTAQVEASEEAGRYREGVGFSGVLLGWSERQDMLYLEVIAPDDLELYYASDDPLEPTVIKHYRRRMLGKEIVEVCDVYDLSDAEAPTFRVYRATLDSDQDGRKIGRRDGDDITADVIPPEEMEKGYFWRWEDGKPWHRIIITGDNRKPFRTSGLIEATLSVCVSWTHWRAATADAGHPQRNTIDLELIGESSDSETGAVGAEAGPETVLKWRNLDPERPGSHWQDGPGFDPEAMGRSNRAYEMSAMSALGLPAAPESTGGEPTETEARALKEQISRRYAKCRRLDSQILGRAAALLNRMGLGPFDESATGCIYREEVEAALAAADAEKASKAAKEAAESAKMAAEQPAAQPAAEPNPKPGATSG